MRAPDDGAGVPVSVRISGGGGLDDPFARVTGHVRAVAEAATLEILAEGERQVVEVLSTGRDPRGFVGRVDTGQARQSLQLAPVRWDGRASRGELAPSGPPADYWPVLEDGRRPGRPISTVGQQRIAVWARRKGVLQRVVNALRARAAADAGEVLPARPKRLRAGERAQLEEQAAFVIQRSIRRKGTPGLGPFRRAAQRLRDGLARQIVARVAARYRGQR